MRLRLSYGRLVLGLGVLAAIAYGANEGQQRWSGNKGSALLGQVVENVTVCSPDGKACYCNESFAGVTVACCAQNQQQLIQALENAVNSGDESVITSAQSALDQFNADFEAAKTDNDSLETFVTNRCAQIECTECNIAIDWVIQYQPPSSASSAAAGSEGSSMSAPVSSQSSVASMSKSSVVSVPESSVSSGAAQQSASTQSVGVGSAGSAASDAQASLGATFGSSTSRSSASSTSRSSVSSMSSTSVSSIQLSSGASSVTSSKSSGASVASSVSSTATLTFGKTGNAGFCCLQGRTKAISCASVPAGSSGNVSDDVCIDIGDPSNPADDIKGVVHESEATCKQQCQWCGDGIIQAARGEQCDNGEPNSRDANAQNISLLSGVTPGKKREIGAVNIPVSFANDTITQEEIDSGINAPWIDSWVPQMEKSSCTTACTIGACGRLQNDRPFSKQLQKCLNAFAVDGTVKCQPFVTQMVDLDGIGKLQKEEYGVLDPDSTAARQYPMVDLQAPGCSILRSRNTVGRFEFQQYGVPLDPQHRQLQEQEDQLSFFQWIRSLMGSLLAAITTQEGAPCSLYSVPGRAPKCGNGLRCVVAMPGGVPTCQPPIPPNSNVAPQKPKPSPPTNYNTGQNNTNQSNNNTNNTSNYPQGTRWNPGWGGTGGNYGGSYGGSNYNGGGGGGGGGGGSTWAVPPGAPAPVITKCSCTPTDIDDTIIPAGWKDMSRDDRIAACTSNGGAMVICQDSYCGGDAPKWPVGHCQDGFCPDPITIPNWCLFLNACTPEKLRQIAVQCDAKGQVIPNPVEQAQTAACYKNNLLVDGGFEDIACDSSGEPVGVKVLNDYVIYVPLPANPSKTDSNYSVYPKLTDPFDQYVEVQSGGSWTRLFGGAAVENGLYDSLSAITFTEQTTFRIVVPLNYAGIVQHFPHVQNTPLSSDESVSIASNDSDHVRIIKNGDIHPILDTHSYDSFTIQNVAQYKELTLQTGNQSTSWVIGSKIAPYFDSQAKAVLEPNQFLVMADFEGPEASSSHGDEYIRNVVIASDMTLVESEKNSDDPFLMRQFADLVLLVTKSGAGGSSLPICSGAAAFGWPKSVGVWGGDPAEAVPTNQGIDPEKGQQMLRFLATSRVNTDIDESADQWQLVDAVAKGIKPGDILNLQAMFNRVELDNETDTEFVINIRYYAHAPQEFLDEASYDDYLDNGGFVLQTDDDPETWERASVLHPVPNGTQTVAVRIAPIENIMNDGQGETEFDGHYADEVCLHIAPECSDGYDNDGDGNYDLDDSGCSSATDDSEYVASSCRDWNLLTNSSFEDGVCSSINPNSQGVLLAKTHYVPLPDDPANPGSNYTLFSHGRGDISGTLMRADSTLYKTHGFDVLVEIETSPGTWEPFIGEDGQILMDHDIDADNVPKMRFSAPVNYNLAVQTFPHLAATSLPTEKRASIDMDDTEQVFVLRNGDLHPALQMLGNISYQVLPKVNGAHFPARYVVSSTDEIIEFFYIPNALAGFFDNDGRVTIDNDDVLIMADFRDADTNFFERLGPLFLDEYTAADPNYLSVDDINDIVKRVEYTQVVQEPDPRQHQGVPVPNATLLMIESVKPTNPSWPQRDFTHAVLYFGPNSAQKITTSATASIANCSANAARSTGKRPSVPNVWDGDPGHIVGPTHGIVPLFEVGGSCPVSPTAPTPTTPPPTTTPPPSQNQQTMNAGTSLYFLTLPDNPAKPASYYGIYPVSNPQIYITILEAETSPGTWESFFDTTNTQQVISTANATKAASKQIAVRGRTPVNYNILLNSFPHLAQTSLKTNPEVVISSSQPEHVRIIRNGDLYPVLDMVAAGSYVYLPDENSTTTQKDPRGITFRRAQSLTNYGHIVMSPPAGSLIGAASFAYVYVPPALKPYFDSNARAVLSPDEALIMMEYQTVKKNSWADEQGVPTAMKQGFTVISSATANGDRFVEAVNKHPNTYLMNPQPNLDYLDRVYRISAGTVSMVYAPWSMVRTFGPTANLDQAVMSPSNTLGATLIAQASSSTINSATLCKHETSLVAAGLEKVTIQVQGSPNVSTYTYVGNASFQASGVDSANQEVFFPDPSDPTEPGSIRNYFSIRFIWDPPVQPANVDIMMHFNDGTIVDVDPSNTLTMINMSGRVVLGGFPFCASTTAGPAPSNSCGTGMWQFDASHIGVMGKQNAPECSDGIDNDSDGSIDMDDQGCDSPTDTSEYTPSMCMSANLLGNSGFEQSITLGAYATSPGSWGGGDEGERVGSENGITPLSGSYMWHSIAAGRDMATYVQSDLWQFIDVSHLPAGTVLGLEGFFNRVGGDSQTDTAFKVAARAYDFPISEFGARNLEFIAKGTARIETDGDTRTWEKETRTITIPPGATFVAIDVTPVENVFNDDTSPEFDGHYSDEVCVYVRPHGHYGYACSDGIDNDGDGKVDALIESTPNQSSTKTLWSGQETSIRDFVNEKGVQLGYTQIPTAGSVGMVNYDSESAKKVCQLAGYADVISYECQSNAAGTPCGFSSCAGNQLAYWDPVAQNFALKDACDMGNQWLAGLTCGGVLAACSDGIDNDRDGNVDFPADNGCNSPDDIDEREHDPECANLKGTSESAIAICTIEDLESEERASSSETPGCHLASDLWQIVEIPPGTKPESFAHGEAFFNHLHMDEETDTHFRVTVRTYDFSPSQFNTRFLDSTREFFQDIESDGVAATWQYANVGFQIPEGTTFMAMKLTAGEDVMNDLVFPEYDAHFADEVCLEIISPAQCEDNYDNDGDGFVDFPDDPGCDSPDDDDETNMPSSSSSSNSGASISGSSSSSSSAIACTPGTICPTGQVCPVNGICSPSCTPGTICPDGQACPLNGICPIGSSSSAGVCDGKRCADNGNAGNLFCQSQNMSCLDSNSPPCLRCVVPTSAGFASSRSASSRSSAISCTPGTQCANGTSCPINGVCPETCSPGNICPNGQSCPVNGLCPQTCSPGNICPTGVSCPLNGVCPPLNQCDEDTDCNTGELCTSGYCSLPICGNGFIDVGEACDGTENCSNQCRLTEGPCAIPGQCQSLVCKDGSCNACQNDNECPAGFRCAEGGCIPQALTCGDGVLDPGEYCDDGNRRDNDACSSDCLLTNNQACALNEQCDSGLCLNGKCTACSDDSQCSEGQICAAGKCIDPNSLYRPMFCGNGRMDAGEECDLGQFNSNAPSALCTYDCRLPDGHRAEGGPNALPGAVVELPFTPIGDNGGATGGNGSGIAGNVTNHAPVGDTGPAAIAVMAAGAAAGFAYMRRKMRP